MFELQKDQLDCPRLRSRNADKECHPDECDKSIWPFEGEDLIGCPVKRITQASMDFIRAYRFYQANKYPRMGGFLDQGIRYIEAMEVVDTEFQNISRIKEEQIKANLNKGGANG